MELEACRKLKSQKVNPKNLSKTELERHIKSLETQCGLDQEEYQRILQGKAWRLAVNDQFDGTKIFVSDMELISFLDKNKILIAISTQLLATF